MSRPACIALLGGELYEPATHRLIALLLAELGGDMVHAGTFFGDMLPSFSQHRTGVVYAFEPVLENYILAKLSVESNRLANVLLSNAALSDRIGISHIDTGGPEAHRGGSSQLSTAGQLTSTTTIDSLALEQLSIIQLDVEGHELKALNGARDTLLRCQPVVLVEDNNADCGSFLESLGYQPKGKIPGLNLWASEPRAEVVERALDSLQRGR